MQIRVLEQRIERRRALIQLYTQAIEHLAAEFHAHLHAWRGHVEELRDAEQKLRELYRQRGIQEQAVREAGAMIARLRDERQPSHRSRSSGSEGGRDWILPHPQ